MTESNKVEALADFDETTFEFEGKARSVFQNGAGPAVIVIHEMPGLPPLVVRFADRIVDAGMTAFLPSLFGTPGKTATQSWEVPPAGLSIKSIPATGSSGAVTGPFRARAC